MIRFLFILALFLSSAAWAHDWKHPDYDNFYDGLKRPGVSSNAFGSISCCSKTDCHETEAQIRGDVWWARLGLPHTREDGGTDWEPADWVQVPADKVLPNTLNPTGNAVICHQVDRLMSGGINPKATIWCFVPSSES